ncbi:rhomboid family intramembrane serine protease [Gordonia sp. PDNC005]|jgi:membrane associated rhomboid family serine protease|uniref:rhomboid family intramembrane serine protease n=1 Tax=unclassified Gordonia (in: high G+C Gram-positive bacteria) TaxID=2657482 RepID=UPI0019658A7D|nr:rhomboid family intramembrane serine protease [Gordonia sp. PDNC005]QRY63644.1 rhomboid family intramembrane serine protease [Gordonia sp. PDNC005]
MIPDTTSPAKPDAPWGRWLSAVIAVAVMAAVLFAVELIDTVMNGRLDAHGIVPRSWSGLLGILWAPFLHADFAHLVGNLLPGVVLGFFVVLSGHAIAVTAVIWVTSGLGVWLISPSDSVTIGASGIVFGWLTFLIVRGAFNRDVWQVLGGVIVVFIYGGILWGALPGTAGVSWQGHLFGAVGGVLAAAVTARDKPAKPALDQGGFR